MQQIKSYNNSTSAWVTEATEEFSIDTNNFANGNSTNLANDCNGNQTFDGTQVYTYDAWNRLMTVSHGYRDSSNNLQHGQAAVTMGYDARGRRISKAVANTGSWDCTYNYYYNGDRQVEQQNGSAQTIKDFVWGLGYIDDLVQTSLYSSPSTQSTCDTPYWPEQDANYNVLGIVNSSGVLTERYEYGAYGQRTTYVSAGSNDPFCTAATTASTRFTASIVEPWGLCEVGHQGLIHDEEDGLVYNRHRSVLSSLNIFMSRDPMGYVDGRNLYAIEACGSTCHLDPSGLYNEPRPIRSVKPRGTFTLTRIAVDQAYLNPGDWALATGTGHTSGYQVEYTFAPGQCQCQAGDKVVLNQAIDTTALNGGSVSHWDYNQAFVPNKGIPPIGYVAMKGSAGKSTNPYSYFDSPGLNDGGKGTAHVEVCAMCQNSGIIFGCATFDWSLNTNDFAGGIAGWASPNTGVYTAGAFGPGPIAKKAWEDWH